MDTTNYDCLVHTFERHSKQKQSGNLDITRQVDKDLAKSCDLLHEVFLFFSLGRRYRQGSSLLKILDSITDVSVFWWLDGATKYLIGRVVAPQFYLKDQLL